MKLSKRTKKIMIAAVSVIVLAFLCSLTAFADGEVAGAVESTWNAAKGQIKTIVNNVVFPVVDVSALSIDVTHWMKRCQR